MDRPTITEVHATLVPAGVETKNFFWGNLRSGDCTMSNARWTLDSDGNAYFDGVVTSSDDNDAWLMWLHLRDSANHELTMVYANDDPSDRYKFVKDLPDHTQQYQWNASGQLVWPGDFNMIAGAVMDYHC